MRTLRYHVATTLDGYIARPDSTIDCFLVSGDHVPDYLEALRRYDAVVMGRRTYEFGLQCGVDDPYPWMDTYVVSRSRPTRVHPRITMLGDEVADAVRRLKERDGGDIYLCGGGELASTLFDAGLVDEITLKVNPALIGRGIGLAPGIRDTVRATLRSTRTYESGVVLLEYAVVH